MQTHNPTGAELLIRAHALFADETFREWVYPRENGKRVYETSASAINLIATGYSHGRSPDDILQLAIQQSLVEKG